LAPEALDLLAAFSAPPYPVEGRNSFAKLQEVNP
jgi:hypothetical protein